MTVTEYTSVQACGWRGGGLVYTPISEWELELILR